MLDSIGSTTLGSLISAGVVLCVLLGLLPIAAGALVTVAVTATVCLIVIRLVLYFTTNRW